MQGVSQVASTLEVCSEHQCCSEASLLNMPACKALAWFTVGLWSTWITSLMDSRLGGQANDVPKLILPHRGSTKHDLSTNCLLCECWSITQELPACVPLREKTFCCSFKTSVVKVVVAHKYVYVKCSSKNRWVNDTVYVFHFSIYVFRLFYRWTSPLARLPRGVEGSEGWGRALRCFQKLRRALQRMCNRLWIEMAQRISAILLLLAPAGFWPSTLDVQKSHFSLTLLSVAEGV